MKHLAFKYRFYPTSIQKSLLSQMMGNRRYVYNWGLTDKTEFNTIKNYSIDYKIIGKIEDYSTGLYILLNRESFDFYVGTVKEKDFSPLVFLSLRKTQELPQYKNLYVETFMSNKGVHRGLLGYLYKFLLEKYGMKIMSDDIHYFGARKLWARLSSTGNFIIDVVNINKRKIIAKDISLIHGISDNEFDEQFYAREGKEHIRFIIYCR